MCMQLVEDGSVSWWWGAPLPEAKNQNKKGVPLWFYVDHRANTNESQSKCNTFAQCVLCSSDFSVSHGERNEISYNTCQWKAAQGVGGMLVFASGRGAPHHQLTLPSSTSCMHVAFCPQKGKEVVWHYYILLLYIRGDLVSFLFSDRRKIWEWQHNVCIHSDLCRTMVWTRIPGLSRTFRDSMPVTIQGQPGCSHFNGQMQITTCFIPPGGNYSPGLEVAVDMLRI